MANRPPPHIVGPARAAMTTRYVTALIIIAILAVAEFIAIDRFVEAQQYRASFINLSARQRMLVQRIAVLGQELLYAGDAATRSRLRAELREVAHAMRTAHETVVHGGSETDEFSRLSPRMRRIYLDTPLELDRQVDRYLASVDSLTMLPDRALQADDRHMQRVMYAASGETSVLLDGAITRLVEAAETDIRRIRAFAGTMLVAMLVGVGLVGLFMFEPMVRRIERTHRLLEQANRALLRLSALDALTGAANRRSFDQRLDEEWRRASRDSTPLALLMIDIDHFKIFNDHYGHQAGDECLRLVSADLKARLRRPADFLARYGGEEFAVVLPDTDLSGATVVAEDLRRRTMALGIKHEASPVARVVTLSLGVAEAEPGPNGADPSELVELADQALYQAKRQGRNQVRTAKLEAQVATPARR